MRSALKPPPTNRRETAEAMRSKLLECAAKILARDGISGLTARRLSAAADASTKVVYNHFGGMPGVIAALYDHGFSMLAKQLAQSVGRTWAGTNVLAITEAYRAFALDNADLFDLMYGPSIIILLPTPDSRSSASAALNILIDAFSDSSAPNAKDRARAFWAAMHGVVALERTGWFDADEAVRRLDDVAKQFGDLDG